MILVQRQPRVLTSHPFGQPSQLAGSARRSSSSQRTVGALELMSLSLRAFNVS